MSEPRTSTTVIEPATEAGGAQTPDTTADELGPSVIVGETALQPQTAAQELRPTTTGGGAC